MTEVLRSVESLYPDDEMIESAAMLGSLHPEHHSGLAEFLLYPDDSELASFVRDRARVLAGDRPIVTEVVHSDEPIAFATGDLVVVSDGLIELFDYQEEVDAILAHEIRHEHAEHVKKGQQHQGNSISQIGLARAHETEADYESYERLDELGINVVGISRAFRKLAASVREVERNKDDKITKWMERMGVVIEDYDHGTLADRAINAEELLRVLDVQNARTKEFTPLTFGPDAFRQYVDESALIDEARQSDNPHLIRYAVERQCSRKMNANVYMPIDERLELHAKALRLVQPELSDTQVQDYSMLAIATAYRQRFVGQVGDEIGDEVEVEIEDIKSDRRSEGEKLLDRRVKQWLESHESLDAVAQAFGPESVVLFDHLNVRPKSWLFRDALATSVEAALSKQTEINMKDIEGFLTKIQAGSFQHQIVSMALTEEVKRRGDDKFPSGFVDFIVRGYLPLGYDSRKLIEVIKQGPDSFYHRLQALVAIQRIKLVEDFKDPLELEGFLQGRHSAAMRLSNNAAPWLPIDSMYWQRGVESFEEGGVDDIDSVGEAIEKRKGEAVEYSQDERLESKLVHPIIEQAYHGMLYNLPPKDFKAYLDDALTAGRADLSAVDRLIKIYFQLDRDGQEQIMDFEPHLRPITKQCSLKDQLTVLALMRDSRDICATLAESAGIFAHTPRTLTTIVDMLAEQRTEYIEAGHDLQPFDAEGLRQARILTDALVHMVRGESSYDKSKQLAQTMTKLPFPVQGYVTIEIEKDDWPSKTETYEIDHYKWLMQPVLDVPMEQRDSEWYFTVAMLSSLSTDTRVRLEVTNAALVKLCEGFSFDEAFDLLDEQTKFLPSVSKRSAWEYLAEEKAETVEQLDRVSQVIRRNVEAFLNKSETIGSLAIVDNILLPSYTESSSKRQGVWGRLPHHRSLDALQAMLLSGEDDSQLAEYLFDRWLFRYVELGNKELRTHFDFSAYRFLQHPEKERRLAYWIRQVPEVGDYEPFELLLDQVFMAGAATKYYLLRKILVGNKGVLLEQEQRQAMVNLLETTLLEDESGAGLAIFRDITKGLMTTTTPDELYSLVAPILTDLTLRYPERRKKFTELAATEAEQLLRQFKVIRSDMDSATVERHINRLGSKIYALMLGGLPEQPRAFEGLEEDVDSQIEPYIREVNKSVDLQLLKLFAGERISGSGRMSPAQFARAIGMQSGALGVRMLQLAGQYFDLPEEDAAVFEDVYDNVRGQTRVQALRVLQREAKAHPEVAEILDNVAHFGKRIGGGSLMTVYKVEFKDGRQMALSVKNPNVEYNLDKVTEILEQGLEHTKHTNPNSTIYPVLHTVMGQVKRWIHDELEDPRFEIKDAQFRLQNDDSLYSSEEQVTLHIPRTVPTGTRRIRCEEYIEGVNLQGLQMTETSTDMQNRQISLSDYRKVVAKLAKNYVEQVLVQGLAHSDVHPGNFRVMNDGRTIAVFDRYNLLELQEDEKLAFGSIAANVMANNTTGAVDGLLDYLQSLSENAGKDQDFANLREDLSQIKTAGVDSLAGMLVKLQQSPVHVPLNFVLVARNFSALNKWAIKAGMSGLAEALTS